MTPTLRTHAHTGALSVLTVAALAAALTAVPAHAAPVDRPAARATSSTASTPTSAAEPSVRTVTMLTGDRVVLRTDAAGRTTASITPDSPHYRRPVEYVASGAHTWVVPKLAPGVRARLDPSVFDVGALAGRVRLTVTFAPGTRARALPGLDVRTSSAHEVPGGRTTATASYDASRPLPAGFASSLAGVSSIAVRGAVDGTAQVVPTYQLHTLTLDATKVNGHALPGADVFVMNTDDGRLFGAFGAIIDGQWKVSVPTGNYVIIGDDFRHVVVTSATVTGDTTASFSMAEATVKPALTLPGYQSLSPGIDILAGDAAGRTAVDFGFGGIVPRVSPLASLASGTLHTEVSDLWTVRGFRQFTVAGNDPTTHTLQHVAAAKQVVQGIPHHLTFHYQRTDFAHVAIKHFATGPKIDALDGWVAFSPLDTGAFVELYPTVRPGVIHGLFLGSKNLTWDSTSSVDQSFRAFSEQDELATYRPGQRTDIPFYRGPVTPVADTGDESDATGRACALCVKNGVLHGFLSMMTSAGSRIVGYDDQGSWDLFAGRNHLQHGVLVMSPKVEGVKPGQKLTLVAQTTPPDRRYLLSSRVSDSWRFVMPASDGAVPLLRADYVPPTNLKSQGNSGRESFPITFDNLGPQDARVTSASVRWSTDGKSWHAASLKRKDGNTFRVSYPNPSATRAHPALSLRVTARDSAGRRVSEQVRNAYLLPKGASHQTHAGPRHRAHRFEPTRLCRTASSHQYRCFVKLNAATRSAGRASPDPAGWGAPALRAAYGLSGPSATTTVAVIAAYDYPSAEADMNTYRRQFGLPACTSASGCFTKLNQKGQEGPYPAQDFGWGVEASLDLQMISAACPTCHIVLVEANQPTDTALSHAETAAVNAGATVTNHSFGRIELTGTDAEAPVYDHAGVTAVASTGDFGYGPASFPASSPDVVAVGGTTLARSSTDPRGWTERAWESAGSGCSAYFDKVAGQSDPACHGRTDSDLSAVAQGLAIYNTSLPRAFKGWLEVDGTSASSPLVAGIIGASGSDGIRPTDLYAEPGAFHDVVGGANGFCQGSYLCTAVAGYDGPTGLGTPHGSIPMPPP